jgi:hypothetical protein
MRKITLVAALLALPLLVSVWWGMAQAQRSDAPPDRERGAQAAAPAEDSPGSTMSAEESVPVREVVMYRSGVAYVERRAEVTNNAEVDLKFDIDDINDLLKSMIVRDLGGGQIFTVTYGSKAPAGELLKTFAVDLQDNPSLAELLKQLRGIRVEVDAPESLAGVIVSIEKQQQQVGDELQEIDVLNLRTERGLKSLPLRQITAIRILDPRLEQELRQALDVLGDALQTEQKTITFQFRGEGRRNVQVGYIKRMPVWKMSYRLVLDEIGMPGEDGIAAPQEARPNAEQNHLLQGWAIVENTTANDWNDVRLSLVSGRPISFVMPLYEPLFADRPEIQLELYAGLRPQRYEQALTEREEARAEKAKAPAPAADQFARQRRAGAAQDALRDNRMQVEQLEQTVQARAESAEVGELFHYTIESPVSIARQQSAMIPVISASLSGQKLSIYNSSVNAKHPLRGVRLKNSTNQFLMDGPVTVYDEGAYAGDALLQNLSPGGERLISFALDLEVEVAPNEELKPQTVVDIRFAKGTLLITRRQIREQTYRIRNSADSPRTLLIEVPLQAGWELVAPKSPAETTRDLYRFQLELAAGESDEFRVETQRTIEERVAVTDAEIDAIVQYQSARSISEETKQRLDEVIARKREIERLTTERAQAQQQLDEIASQQDRIRKNMAEIDRNTDLYARYITKLSQQEDDVEMLRKAIDRLTSEIEEKRDALDTFLLNGPPPSSKPKAEPQTK